MSRGLPSRIAIIGSNGYLGSRLVAKLVERSEVELVLGVGRRPLSRLVLPKFHYCSLPGDSLTSKLLKHRITSVVYLAFISCPTHDESAAYRTNVLNTATLLEAVGRASIKEVVLISSVAVYGPGPRMRPATETDAPNANGFQFSQHKVLQEQVAWQQSKCVGFELTILRPCTVVGPGASNFLLACLGRAIVPLPAGANPDWQFLHEEDFCEVVIAVLQRGLRGVYNVVPDDAIPIRQAIRLLGSKPISVPKQLLFIIAKLGWSSHLQKLVPAPPSALDFLCSAPVASNSAIREVLNFEFRYHSREAVQTVQHSLRGLT